MSLTLAYLKYLWRSTNEHGVHSPFVFTWVTQAIYGKQHPPLHPILQKIDSLKRLSKKDLMALNRTLHHHFGPGDLPISSLQTQESVKSTGAPLVFLDISNTNASVPLSEVIDSLENDTLLLVRKTREPLLWKSIKEHQDIHLTIDCFSIGYAMKRKQQAKENFIIRL